MQTIYSTCGYGLKGRKQEETLSRLHTGIILSTLNLNLAQDKDEKGTRVLMQYFELWVLRMKVMIQLKEF